MSLLSAEIGRKGRVVVVVAHPDDEVLGCGALLAQLDDVRIVHVTDGAPRAGEDAHRHGFAGWEAYAAARRAEAEEALALVGVSPSQILGLGLPDQEVAHRLTEAVAALRPILAEAEVVLTHCYEGGHPDHDATAFAVAACCRQSGHAGSAVYEMPFYHADQDGWIRQRFPVGEPEDDSPAGIREIGLDPTQRALKSRMLAAHRSQAETLSSFSLDAERFRSAGAIDFLARPHAGPLLYERHGWNLTWGLWQTRIREASRALGLT